MVNIFGFKARPKEGEKATIIPVRPGIPAIDLRILYTEKAYGCDYGDDPWWSVELEPIKAEEFFSVSSPKGRRRDYPSDVVVIYPSTETGVLIEKEKLVQEQLPKDIAIETVKAAVDVTGNGDPDVLIVEYCCGNPGAVWDGDCYECGETFKRVNGVWKLVDSSQPC